MRHTWMVVTTLALAGCEHDPEFADGKAEGFAEGEGTGHIDGDAEGCVDGSATAPATGPPAAWSLVVDARWADASAAFHAEPTTDSIVTTTFDGVGRCALRQRQAELTPADFQLAIATDPDLSDAVAGTSAVQSSLGQHTKTALAAAPLPRITRTYTGVNDAV